MLSRSLSFQNSYLLKVICPETDGTLNWTKIASEQKYFFSLVFQRLNFLHQPLTYFVVI